MNVHSDLHTLLLFCLCLCACERRPLGILATGMTVRICPECREYCSASGIPDNYRVNLYDLDDGHLVYKDFAGGDSEGTMALPGRFLCFVCNYDIPRLIMDGEDNSESFHISVPPVNGSELPELLPAAIRGNGTITLDDDLWCGRQVVDIPYLDINDENFVIDINVSPLFQHGYIRIKDVSGLENLAGASVLLTCFSRGIHPVTGVVDTTSATLMVGLSPHKEENELSAAFSYFGLTDEQREMQHLAYVLTTGLGGEQLVHMFDVSETIRRNDCGPLEIDISSGISIPEPSSEGSGGFAPNVDNWEAVHYEVLL